MFNAKIVTLTACDVQVTARGRSVNRATPQCESFDSDLKHCSMRRRTPSSMHSAGLSGATAQSPALEIFVLMENREIIFSAP